MKKPTPLEGASARTVLGHRTPLNIVPINAFAKVASALNLEESSMPKSRTNPLPSRRTDNAAPGAQYSGVLRGPRH